MKKIYIDNAATTPVDPQVLKAMEPYFYEHFGNAASPHSIGRDSQKALEDARETVAQFIGANPDEIVFTSGGTESNNHGSFGTISANKDRGKHIIVSHIEHHAILEPIEYLENNGYTVTYIPVDEKGVVNPDDIEKAIQEDTILIALMHANNEVGSIQPVAQVGQIVRANEKKISFLVDAVQTVGHIPVNVNDLNCDLMSMSAHKFYGPKGVGALYIREGTKIGRYMFGGDHEKNRRASTQNVAAIVGMAAAIKLCEEKMDSEAAEQIAVRDRIITEVPKKIEGVKVNGHTQNRLPNNIHFSFEKLQGEALLMALDMENICASMGSACTAGALEPSHVLKAMGVDTDLAFGSLRLTLGRFTTESEVDYLLDKLPKLVNNLRI